MRKRTLLIAGMALALLLVGVACVASPTDTPAAGNQVVVPGGVVQSGSGLAATGAEAGSIIYTNIQQVGIWVSGLGKVKVVPDVALLTLGVEARAISVAEAMGQASRAMEAVMAVLKDNGVADTPTTSSYKCHFSFQSHFFPPIQFALLLDIF